MDRLGCGAKVVASPEIVGNTEVLPAVLPETLPVNDPQVLLDVDPDFWPACLAAYLLVIISFLV